MIYAAIIPSVWSITGHYGGKTGKGAWSTDPQPLRVGSEVRSQGELRKDALLEDPAGQGSHRGRVCSELYIVYSPCLLEHLVTACD